tara:strand:- start:140 stop:844 length:705 start_codon:yes stop_codon:yes gene_type:complete
MNSVIFKNLGIIKFKEAWDLQERLLNSIIDVKKQNRINKKQQQTKNYLLFCEHPDVYTLGKSGDQKNLLLNNSDLKKNGIDFFKINRGGDITYHGPGQLVIYPIFDLDNFFTDVHKYLRFLEEVVILVLKKFGIKGNRLEGATGVWVDINGSPRKICAMGVRASRWVTMHGLAFNVSVNLDRFKGIVPCGISDKSVTSLELELNKKVLFNDVVLLFREKFKEVFNIILIDEKVF